MTKNVLAARSVSIICPEEVFELQEEKSIPVKAEACVGCKSCVEVCEKEAITVTEV